ncbi:nuclear transport factor 2 family protein [Streptomyces millisiae]|uniref:Nuclear transport factor 2 family protein n=1 Tax=Streptomyces millisiae TaxID=3075542 RepID=A0ABU2LUE3_9ACTN|nr:nuclear transport factor 2 family protein [Streptomyces sp. DSM 44918]MDT0321194.1 nuclear transport factor 2 family protein [Streptomyces sp. DSM 44918]
MSSNISLVRRIYDSEADPAVLQEVIAPDIVWDITPGFPGGGVYHGFESVGRDFFGPLFERFDALHAVGEEYYADDEGHVCALGHYHCVTKRGNSADVRFIHIWTVRDGKLTHLRQVADSLAVDGLVNG